MNCRDCQERLSAYSDGELTDDVRAPVETHLAECLACRTKVGLLRDLSAVFATCRPNTVPSAGLWRRIEAAAAEKVCTPPAPRVRWWKFVPRAAAAVIGFVAFMGVAGLFGWLPTVGLRGTPPRKLATARAAGGQGPLGDVLAQALPRVLDSQAPGGEPALLDDRAEWQVLTALLKQREDQ